MELKELGREYICSAQLCRERAAQRRQDLKAGKMSESERIALRRKISMLEEMGRQAAATGRYLVNYYGRRNDENTGKGVSGDTELPAEAFAVGKPSAAKAGKRHSAGADAPAGPDSAYVLFGTAYDAWNS